jgi:hypothetical protein
MDLFFQFFSFCNFKQKPEGLGVEGGGVEVEEWKPGGQCWGYLWRLSQSRQKGEGREESKSQLERGFGFFFFFFLLFFKWKQYCGKNVRPARTRLKPRWLEERKIYYATGPQNCGSKQEGRTKADEAVSLSLGGYNISY